MNLQEAIELINTSRGTGLKNNLDRMNQLLDKIGHPERDLRFIHIAGTNGKGTTCSFIYRALRQSPKKIGLYTSPHLEHIHERIQVNDQKISTNDLIRLTDYLKPYIDQIEEERKEKMYSFEIFTALAFLYFKEQKTELVVFETGIGGRVDATNVIPSPILAVITMIGNDHMGTLGESLPEIAWQKAGIIKKETSVVVYPMEEQIMEVFKKEALKRGARLSQPDFSKIRQVKSSVEGQCFSYQSISTIELSLIGHHQIYNAVLALEALLELIRLGFPLTIEQIKIAFKKTKWPGRMEVISYDPLFLIDGAHNRQGVEMLEKNLKQLFDYNDKLTLIFGMMKDKEFRFMIDKMSPLANKVLVVSPDWERGINPKEVAQSIQTKQTPAYPLEGSAEIYDYVVNQAKKDEKIVLFGSLYLVGDVRKLFNEKGLID